MCRNKQYHFPKCSRHLSPRSLTPATTTSCKVPCSRLPPAQRGQQASPGGATSSLHRSVCLSPQRQDMRSREITEAGSSVSHRQIVCLLKLSIWGRWLQRGEGYPSKQIASPRSQCLSSVGQNFCTSLTSTEWTLNKILLSFIDTKSGGSC